MRPFTRAVNRAVGGFLIFLMVVMVLDVTWQVFTRFILNNPSSFTEELAGFLLIWIGILGASYAFYTRSHLGIDLLTFRLKGAKRRAVDVLVNAIVFLFAVSVMGLGGLRLVLLTLTLEQISPSVGIPMGYVYTVIPLSGGLIALYALGFLWESIKSVNPTPEAEHQISILD
jgi:TRAP-type C4-dicarboxylate transport system permease small subunit